MITAGSAIIGGLVLAGVGAFAAAVALAERHRLLGGAAAVTIWLMVEDAFELRSATVFAPVVLAVLDAILIGTVIAAWSAGSLDFPVRVAVGAFVASAVLVLVPGSYPAQGALVAVSRLVAVGAWACVVGVRAYLAATRGLPARR